MKKYALLVFLLFMASSVMAVDVTPRSAITDGLGNATYPWTNAYVVNLYAVKIGSSTLYLDSESVSNLVSAGAFSATGRVDAVIAMRTATLLTDSATVSNTFTFGGATSTGRLDAAVALRTGALTANSATISNLASVGAVTATGALYSAVNVLGPQGTFAAVTVSNLATLGAVSSTGTLHATVGFKIGTAAQIGFSGVVTNGRLGEVTNILYFSGGICTNMVETE